MIQGGVQGGSEGCQLSGALFRCGQADCDPQPKVGLDVPAGSGLSAARSPAFS